MLFVLYQCGKSLRKDYRIFSAAGVVSMLVYTLNEGLRFGRGGNFMKKSQKAGILKRTMPLPFFQRC